MKKWIALSLALALLLSMAGCVALGGRVDPVGDTHLQQSGNKTEPARDLMQGVQPRQLSDEEVTISGENVAVPMDFAVRLFRECLGAEENVMISPVSVLYALAMTANGAKGETLAQMEEVLGMDISALNTYLKAYMAALPESETYKLHLANSLWLTDDERFTVVPAFLQTNADYYGADIYQLPLDEAACSQINDWVADNTDGMIPKILDEIPAEAVMYLINAVTFDAEWQEIYREDQIRSGTFTAGSGEKQTAQMMHSEERLYLEDGSATGFIKYYADWKYAFVALLPNEGVSVQEYAASLSGETLSALLADAQETTVYATMPKFESGYSVEMSEVLREMGMQDAFDAAVADLSGLGTSTAGNVFISRVLHKTFISVDERGTRAGAATAVEAVDTGTPVEVKNIVLDRPFVYMIVDCETNLPLFMGTLTDVG